MADELWFVSAGTDRAQVSAWLVQSGDGRVFLSVSDADAIDIGVELRVSDVRRLRDALDPLLGE